ncbi:hypothetical protein TNCV_72351 [Trichonephila clavipes]|uniref:Uncharacterized protein n=1 Tax=Trichonephila clavipes TaxID=2585209 RepID=A0A8X6RBM2_TRICX|nr:hypothetical protein TNCV_72351 [Trichonephila clavipes]
MDFGSRHSTRVPLLNTRHWAARLIWAREERDWSTEDWKRVALSDDQYLEVNPVERFQKLVESMACRVASVIKARGDPTRY